MTFRLEIEADSYGELVQKVIQHLHLPIDVGTHIEVREKIASALATGVEEARQIEAGEAPPISSAQGFDVVAGPAPTAETPQKRKRRTKAEMEAERAVEAAPVVLPGEQAASAEPAPAEVRQIAVPVHDVPAPLASIFDDEPVLAKITEEDFRKKLQDFASRDNGTGLRDLIPILQEFDYSKVKGIKPEHYAPIAARLDEFLKAA